MSNKLTWRFDIPVIFIFFNRLDTASRVFEAIKKARPRQLFLVSDGPRGDHPGEAGKVNAVRNYMENIDWDCEVYKDYSETNLGCDVRVPLGITNAFKIVERAIILEDDCVPSDDFFKFSQELLERYKDEKKISHISGMKFLKGSFCKESYCYSEMAYTWGWATWKDRWEQYGVDFEEKCKNYLDGVFSPKNREGYMIDIYRRQERGEIIAWDEVWQISLSGTVGIVPKNNLVENIGFSGTGTHTAVLPWGCSSKTKGITFPLMHPDIVCSNKKYLRVYQRRMFYHRWALIARITGKLQLLYKQNRKSK